jgi:hypothetical protein
LQKRCTDPVVPMRKIRFFQKFSLRAELRAENGFFYTHRGDPSVSKNFFSKFCHQKFVEWVIEVGEAEYRTFFEIGQAVRELPWPNRGAVFSKIFSKIVVYGVIGVGDSEYDNGFERNLKVRGI